MRFTLKPLAFAALSCLALSACQDGNDQVQTAKSSSHAATTPLAAINANLDAMKQGDLKALVLNSAPPEMIEHMRTKWTQEMNKEPITEEDRAKFTETMTMFTAEGAEQKLWQDLEPKFKELQAEAQFQLPMWIGMGQSVLGSMVTESKDLTDAQKKQAMEGVQAFGSWASSAQFLDSDRAQKSIGIVCNAAREMKLESLDQVRALKFDEALDKGNVGYRATKDLLANYGFSLDDMMKTMKAELVSQEGDAAKVKVSYQMFQTPLEFESDMVRVDGGWYSKESVEKLRAEMAGETTESATEDSAAES